MIYNNPFISIAIPVYHSHNILPELCSRIHQVKEKNQWNLELVFVDDGSKDQSYATLCELQKKYPYLSCLKLSRNFGHQNALRTALTYCRGDYVAIMDDDLQDPPELLPQFFDKIIEGLDIVYGIRTKRKEVFWKVFMYSFFYRILNTLSDIPIPLDSGDFCMMRKSVLQSILLLEERTLFLRGIRSWVGWKSIGIPYQRPERFHGDSGYTLKKLFSIAFSGIVSFSFLPLRGISLLGLLGLFLSFLYSCYILTAYFFQGIHVQGFTTLSLLILIFGSFNLLSLGIMGEYLSKIYTETKKRPFAIISECNFSSPLAKDIYEGNFASGRKGDPFIPLNKNYL
jgi:dolichol-phosphate mannosyltransferase